MIMVALNDMAKFRGDMVFVSYLNEPYDKSKFKPIRITMMTQLINKCKGGLWACPAESRYGWKEWCKDNEFNEGKLNNAFFFKLSPNAKIYAIHDIGDLESISTAIGYMGDGTIDFQRLLDEGYDGIYVSEEAANAFHSFAKRGVRDLNSWDVESICTFNPDVIIPIENGD